MTQLPSETIPLNQHSIFAIEAWLNSLGAIKNETNPCIWTWRSLNYFAEIEITQDELKVTWKLENKETQFSFPYGLPRRDVEAALKQGP